MAVEAGAQDGASVARVDVFGDAANDAQKGPEGNAALAEIVLGGEGDEGVGAPGFAVSHGDAARLFVA
jgi:hypothetical protein